jgi:DNA-binding helix-hairpin-helix protein with protein kinase domain
MLGRGGEAVVYHVESEPDIAIKIYTDGKAAERREKVGALVSGGYYRLTGFVAFPVNAVMGQNGEFLGFAMRKVVGVKPIHELYAPGSRTLEFPKADFRFLVRTALNVSKAIASVHQTGCVIGDINHSGILVSEKATVTLIDSDSFQICSGSKVYRCRVGTGEYTPPELQGHKLENVDRSPVHDAFGLAVILFQLLFMGRHPFSGRYNGPEHMPIEKAIREGRFAYSHRKAETRMEPPPFVPTLSDMPQEVSTAFERAFQPVPNFVPKRPAAADWVGILGKMEADLITCRFNPVHHHTRNASSCPWCRLEAGLGITLFPATASQRETVTKTTFDLSQVLAAIERVVAPGPLPDVTTLISLPRLQPSPAALKARSAKRTRWFFGVGIAVFSLILVAGGLGVALLGLLFALSFFGRAEAIEQLQIVRRRAEEHWNLVRAEWQAEAGPGRFDQKRVNLKRWAEEHGRLPAVQKAKLDELERQKRDLQLRNHLEGHFIARARIPKIGDGRKATLASYGLETAWDITSRAVMSVPGFGAGLTQELLDWRTSVEKKFVFNPSLATDPVAIRRVTDEINRTRIEFEQALLRGPIELQQIAAHAAAVRSRPGQRLVEAYVALKQAELDLRSV